LEDSVVSPRRTLRGSLFALPAAIAALVAGGCDGSTTPLEPAKRASPAPIVEYPGPEMLTDATKLRARATSRSGRVVAVTFLLDGRPLGSDTTPPYELDVDPSALPSGRHRLRVVAVDRLGRRRATAPVTVESAAARQEAVTATPETGLHSALAALGRGGVTVRLGPGRYELSEVRIGSGARLVGAGARTVISAPQGKRYWALLIAKGKNIRISDLTLDGGGSVPEDASGGIAVAVFDGSSDVRLQRLRMVRVRTDGVNTWGAHSNISVQDSRIESDGTGEAGVVALGSDESRDMSVIRTRVRGFRSFGILLQQQEHGRPAADLHGIVLDNVVSDIRNPARDACWTAAKYDTPGCGTDEGGIWTGGVEAAVIGNTVRRARWDGIETVGSSTRTTIVRNRIYDTRTGIYLEHSTHRSLIAHNLIVDALTGINVEWWHEGAGSRRNTFAYNRFVSSGGLVIDVGGDGNRIVGNVFVGGRRPAIVLQGSSDNLVQGNRGCRGPDGPLVGFDEARYDDGRPAVSRRNRLVENLNRRSDAC
jgi:parallel beta-helix repeat protein